MKTKILYVIKELTRYFIRLLPLIVTVVIFYFAPLLVALVVALAWFGYFLFRLATKNRSNNQWT